MVLFTLCHPGTASGVLTKCKEIIEKLGLFRTPSEVDGARTVLCAAFRKYSLCFSSSWTIIESCEKHIGVDA